MLSWLSIEIIDFLVETCLFVNFDKVNKCVCYKFSTSSKPN